MWCAWKPARPTSKGEGQITMRDLVKNCLRMRPERIIVGEVRGPEAFDLLQAMNTGHDGSMGTLHANSPREAMSRCESMITMGGYSLPAKTIREMIVASIDVIIQAARLRDGSRRITHITEVMGMEGDVRRRFGQCHGAPRRRRQLDQGAGPADQEHPAAPGRAARTAGLDRQAHLARRIPPRQPGHGRRLFPGSPAPVASASSPRRCWGWPPAFTCPGSRPDA
jgi:hypothetical protein